MTQTTPDPETQDRATLTFSIVHDDSGPRYGEPRFYAVLDFPGPDAPYGALDAAQALTEAAERADTLPDLADGEMAEAAGLIAWPVDAGPETTFHAEACGFSTGGPHGTPTPMTETARARSVRLFGDDSPCAGATENGGDA